MLLTVFLFNLFGYFPLFKFAQHKIQKEIKTRLKRSVPEEELFVIVIAKNKVAELDWKREGKELKYKGTMYDIVRMESKGAYNHYYCINDKQENALFTNLEDLVNKQFNTDKSPAGKTARGIIKTMISAKYISIDRASVIPSVNEISANFCYNFSIKQVFLEILTPPPNSIVV